MNNYLQQFHLQLAEYQKKCNAGEPIPVLELLWQCYYNSKPIDDGRIKEIEEKLAPAFDVLSFEDSNDAFTMIGELIDAYQRAAFLEGIQIGAQLTSELSL